MPVPDPDDLATTLADIARRLSPAKDLLPLLDLVCTLAAATVESASHADVILMTRRKATVPAATDWVGTRIVSIESELDQGPCLEAIRTGTMVIIEDHTTETRWPEFTKRCLAESPARSSMGVPLTTDQRTLGAIDLYADEPHAFDDEDAAIGALFAVHAAVAVAAAREREDFSAALAGRDIIGQAKGILMARDHISADDAFDVLRRASQRLNVKLREVAQEVIDNRDQD